MIKSIQNISVFLFDKGVGNYCPERQGDLTTLPLDAGASPERAGILDAIEALDGRTSTSEADVRLNRQPY